MKNVDKYGEPTNKQSLKDRAKWGVPFNAVCIMIICGVCAIWPSLGVTTLVISWLVGAVIGQLIFWYLDDMPKDARDVGEYKVYK